MVDRVVEPKNHPISLTSHDARIRDRIGLRSLHVVALGLILITVCGPTRASAQEVLEVGKFSASEPNGLPQGWETLTFEKIDRHSQYSLVKDGQTTVVKAVSKQSSSGLIRKIRIDPRKYPIVKWRWKISNVLKKGDVTHKSGDDYPARIYITFEYDPNRVGFFEKAKYEAVRLLYGEYPPLGALNYIWASNAGKGRMVPNPYTDEVTMFVVESGSELVNQWVAEERNVYEDYTRAFGIAPPMISGVAIMTDTDNTGETAASYYGDIVFKKAAP